MWLLNATTRCLEHFHDQNGTDYAILSHTWGEEEVTFQDMQIRGPSRQFVNQKRGYQKIEYTCVQALADGLQYVWIDTCCIDKSSSAELSEAINSMFNWYSGAKVCYAYLSDVHSGTSQTEQFRSSRWFTRGWTLQELLAPEDLSFYTSDWRMLGTKSVLAEALETITGIKVMYLNNIHAVFRASVAQRMSWAAHRKTTRVEDRAYSLLGIFDINLALLYGEGTKAFWRLQEEIIRRSTDQSVFAWSAGANEVLAGSPDDFAGSGRVIRSAMDETPLPARMEISGAGIQLDAPVLPLEEASARGFSQNHIIILNSMYEDDPRGLIGLKVYSGSKGQTSYPAFGKDVLIILTRDLIVVPLEDYQKAETRCILLTSEAWRNRQIWSPFSWKPRSRTFWFRPHGKFAEAYKMVEAFPRERWKSAESMLQWPYTTSRNPDWLGYVTWKSTSDESYVSVAVKLLPLTEDNPGRNPLQKALYKVQHSRAPITLADSEKCAEELQSTAWEAFVTKRDFEEHDWARSLSRLMAQDVFAGKIVVYGEFQWRLEHAAYILDIGMVDQDVAKQGSSYS